MHGGSMPMCQRAMPMRAAVAITGPQRVNHPEIGHGSGGAVQGPVRDWR